MPFRQKFAAITQVEQPLAPLTLLQLGGPAELLVTPRTREELCQVVSSCFAEKIPLRVLGVGTNLLVRDEGIRGVVLRLNSPAFTGIEVNAKKLRAGGGAPLSDVIAEACRNNLAGFESLVGIAATIGGALRFNAGDRSGEIADFVGKVEVVDELGQVLMRNRSELRFGDHSSDIDDPVVLSVEFELERDTPEAIDKRLRRAWIVRNASLPYRFQPAVRMFKNPRGHQAAALVEQAGLGKARIGGAEVSDRNANYVVAHAGTTGADVTRLLELIQSEVRRKCGVQLDLELTLW